MATKQTPVPLIYTLYLLNVEPLLAIAGSYLVHFHPTTYLSYLEPLPSRSESTNPTLPVPPPLQAVFTQLASACLFFALTAALVLRSTSDQRVWRTLIGCMLIVDLGGIVSLWPLSGEKAGMYWRAWEWSEKEWSNVGIVYLGLLVRGCFMFGVGIGGDERKKNGEEGKDE